jgi:uncharacterized protein (TIGR00730 family)
MGVEPAYERVARALGQRLAAAGIGLVYGGGSVGLMGAVADGALAAGGEVIGIIPESLARAEVAHAGLTQLEVVPDMHTRKARMAALSHGFIALPGGIGTLEELFETWTWAQLGYHAKPIGLLDVDGFYQPLLQFLEHTLKQGFIRQSCRDLLYVEQDAQALLKRLQAAIGAGASGFDATPI